MLSCPQGQLSYDVLVRGVTNSPQSSDINIFLGSSPDQGCPPGLWLKQATIVVGPYTQTWPPVTAQVRTPPWSQVALLAIHMRVFFTTLQSPVMPLLFVSTSFRFSFSSISPQLPFSSYCCQGTLSVWGHLKRGLRSTKTHSCIVTLGRGHLVHGLSPQVCVALDW